jgi:hypothetical protein
MGKNERAMVFAKSRSLSAIAAKSEHGKSVYGSVGDEFFPNPEKTGPGEKTQEKSGTATLERRCRPFCHLIRHKLSS